MKIKYRNIKIGFLLILFSSLVTLGADCGVRMPSWGDPYIVNPLPDTRFVKSAETFIMCCGGEEKAWGYYSLDGKLQRRLFDSKYKIRDISADGQVFVLSHRDTTWFISRNVSADGQFFALYNGGGPLFIARDGGKTITEVPEFRQRGLSFVKISPTGKYLIGLKFLDDGVSTHWRGYEINVIDLHTFKTTVLLDTKNDWSAHWLDDRNFEFKDGDSLVLVNAETGEVVPMPSQPKINSKTDLWKEHSLPTPVECGLKFEWENNDNVSNLKVIDSNQNSKLLLESTFQDPSQVGYIPSDGPYILELKAWVSSDCRFLVFENSDDLWVAEVETGKVGPISPRQLIFFHRWGWVNLGGDTTGSEKGYGWRH